MEANRPLAAPIRWRLAEIDRVLFGRSKDDARSVLTQKKDGVIERIVRVPDLWMSGTHARLVRDADRWLLEDTGSKNGTWVNGRAVQRAVLADGDLVEVGHTLFLFRDRVPVKATDDPDLDAGRATFAAPAFATLRPELHEALLRIAKGAKESVSVVIRGETGTGKEGIARAIHELSGRTGAFIAVNCGGLPANLVESELFGHKRGAFSGAHENRPGYIHDAEGGTLFLDEIGDLPLPAQAVVLRALQERQVTPVGATRPIAVDFRLIAATHRDLEEMVEEQEFRKDLYARLGSVRIDLPPLRDRREDLGLLVSAILRKLVPERAAHVSFEVEAARALFVHDWSLNIRELEHALRSALLLVGDNEPIKVEHLPGPVRESFQQAQEGSEGRRAPAPPRSAADEELKAKLRESLAAHKGNLSAVARAMGKDRRQIVRWMKRFKLNRDDFRK